MTAPTPPPPPDSDHPQQAYDPWAPPPQTEEGKGGYGGVATPGSAPGMPVRAELRDGAFATLALTVLGVLLGLLWLWLSPRVPLVSDGSAVFLKHPEGEEAIGSDGTFVLLSLAVGALAGAAVFLLRREGGIGLVVGIAVGAFLAALLAWRLGVWLGPTGDLAAHAREAGKGKVFDAPLNLEAKGVLFAFPFAALAVHLLLTAVFGRRDPEPPLRPGGW